jgi:hypothetical protein
MDVTLFWGLRKRSFCLGCAHTLPIGALTTCLISHTFTKCCSVVSGTTELLRKQIVNRLKHIFEYEVGSWGMNVL